MTDVPPPGYLEARGVNLRVRFAAASEEDALRRAAFAVKGGSRPVDAFRLS